MMFVTVNALSIILFIALPLFTGTTELLMLGAGELFPLYYLFAVAFIASMLVAGTLQQQAS